jgi:O-antigen/teichoic acid export membrane protein
MGPLLPGLVRLGASERADEFRALYRGSLQGIFLTVVPSVMLLAFVAYQFLGEWAGTEDGRYRTGPFFVILARPLFSAFTYVPYT